MAAGALSRSHSSQAFTRCWYCCRKEAWAAPLLPPCPCPAPLGKRWSPRRSAPGAAAAAAPRPPCPAPAAACGGAAGMRGRGALRGGGGREERTIGAPIVSGGGISEHQVAAIRRPAPIAPGSNHTRSVAQLGLPEGAARWHCRWAQLRGREHAAIGRDGSSQRRSSTPHPADGRRGKGGGWRKTLACRPWSAVAELPRSRSGLLAMAERLPCALPPPTPGGITAAAANLPSRRAPRPIV